MVYDPDTCHCPKCGETELGLEWGQDKMLRDGYKPFWVERLKLACTRCGYSWNEAPMDAMQPDKGD
jgi:hypothetical protein